MLGDFHIFFLVFYILLCVLEGLVKSEIPLKENNCFCAMIRNMNLISEAQEYYED